MPAQVVLIYPLRDITRNIADRSKLRYILIAYFGYVEFLLKRHQIIEEFLALLGIRHSLLAETEMIEHNISLTTLERIQDLNEFFKAYPEIYSLFQKHGSS